MTSHNLAEPEKAPRKKKKLWRRWLDVVPKWDQIKALGESRTVKSSYVWIFVVPAIAKFLEATAATITLPVPGGSFVLTLGLPFKLTLFYGASLAFASGALMYSLFCPSVVKKYNSYKDFEDSGKGDDILLNAFARLYQHIMILWPLRIDESLRDFFLSNYTTFADDPSVLVRGASGTPTSVVECAFRSEKRASAFWFVWHNLNRSRPLLRITAVMFFLLGFGLLAWILGQNAQTVWKLTR